MKRSFFLFLLVVLAQGVWAQAISEQDAKARVLQYLKSSDRAKARPGKPLDIRLTPARVGAEKIYAFNLDGGGYVIASGDCRALPVLGYSDSGHIDWENMPATMKWWLKSYDEAIASLGNRRFVDGNPVDGRAMTRAGTMTAIAPLLKTQWDQDAPYWFQCPVYKGYYEPYKNAYSVTGCVATAMAQVMAYHQWPKEACKEIPAYDFEYAFEGVSEPCHLDALPSVTFSWDKMLDTYTKTNPGTTDQQNAVAELMRYCGQSVKMNYSPEYSGSDHIPVLMALRKYFGYDQGAENIFRVNYSIAEWENAIYKELAEGRPVQYGGYSDDGGHSFVCDGYDGEGLFHINWGWSGGGDGYFSLSVLNPYNNTSAGSGSSGIGFCIGQDCLIGVKPASEAQEYEPVLPSVSLWDVPWKEDVDQIGIMYLTYCADYEGIPISAALGLRSEEGVLYPLFTAEDKLTEEGVTREFISVDSTWFDNSTMYALYPMVKLGIEGCDWQMIGSTEYFVVAGKNTDGQFFLGKIVPELTIDKAFISKGRGYLAERSDITLTLHNSGSEVNESLYLLPIYLGDSTDPDDASEDKMGDWMECGAYLPAGESTDVTWSFVPMARGNVLFQLYTPEGYYMDAAIVQMNDTLRTINQYISMSHHLIPVERFGEDFELVPNENMDIVPGKYEHMIWLKKIPEAKLPEGCVISDRLLFEGFLADADNTVIAETQFDIPKDFIQSIAGLDVGESDSTSVLNVYTLPIGGVYQLFFVGAVMGDSEVEYINWKLSAGFAVEDSPSIRVSGDSIVTSGSPVELSLHYSSGYPYKATDFTGNELAQWELQKLYDDNTFEVVDAGEEKLSFATPTNEQLAVVDTIPLTFTLPDGKYRLNLTSNWGQMPTRKVFLTVGDGTGISSVEADGRDEILYDLQGRRLEGALLRKGIYIRQGKKVIIR